MVTYEFTFAHRQFATPTAVSVPVVDDYGEGPAKVAAVAMAEALDGEGFIVSPVQRHEVRHVWETVTP